MIAIVDAMLVFYFLFRSQTNEDTYLYEDSNFALGLLSSFQFLHEFSEWYSMTSKVVYFLLRI